MRHPLLHLAEGALAGVVGSIVMGKQLEAAAKLPEELQPTTPQQHPGEFVAEKVERLARRPVAQRFTKLLAHSLHFVYGSTWAALLGALSERIALRRGVGRALLAGVGLGAAVWAIGYVGWLPATRLTPPIQRQGAAHATTSLLTHVGYGLATALPLFGLQKLEQRTLG